MLDKLMSRYKILILKHHMSFYLFVCTNLNCFIKQKIQITMGMNKSLLNILIISLALRVVPIIVIGFFQNIEKGQISITDIDYKVYSDSTRYDSPYDRHTYRYSPILSYLMTFNYTVYEQTGKIIFALFDLIAVYFLWKITSKCPENQDSKSKQAQKRINQATLIAKLYGYNPLFLYLTVRGSCQSIQMALMYAFWYFFFGKNSSGNLVPEQIKQRKIQQFQTNPMHKIYAYLIYGLWVHYRMYPIMFLPLILLFQYRSCINQSTSKFMSRLVTIGVVAGGVFLFLLLVFYSLYGQEFLQQNYLYHFTRKDNRHSFSPFFYDIYLYFFQSKPIRMLPCICFLFLMINTFSRRYSIFYIQFLMTFGFVEFNTVITLQYYQWVYGALFLVLPQSRIITFKQHKKGFNLALQWFLGVAVWIWMSLKLQGEGDNILTAVWVICLVKILIDLWVLIGFMKTVKVQNAEQIKKINLEQARELLMGKHKLN